MKKNLPFFGLFLLGLVFTFLPTNQVYSKDSDRLVLSTVNVPVIYRQEELERSLNRYYLEEEKGIFCLDDSFTNFDNDHLKNICRQKEDIKITIEDGVVKTQVSITIDATYLLEKTFDIDLGFYQDSFTFNLEKSIPFDIFVTFETKAQIDKDLIIVPHTTWTLEWLSYPNVDFGFYSFRVDSIAEKAIARTLDEFATDRIDKTIIKKVDIKEIIRAAWKLTEDPFLIDKKRGIWALVNPTEIRAGQLELKNGALHFYFESDFYSYLGFDIKELLPFKTFVDEVKFPQLLPVYKKDNAFFVDFLLDIKPAKLESLITEVIEKGDYEIATDGLKLVVSEIYVNKINKFIETDIYLKNTNPNDRIKQYRMSLKFIPYYSKIEKKIKIRNLTYKLQTDSLLVNLGSRLFQKSLKEGMEKNIAISSVEFLTTISSNLNRDLERVPIDEQKVLGMKIAALQLNGVTTSKTSLILFLTALGTANVELVNLF